MLNISYIDVAPVDIADVARLGAKVAPKVANKFRPLRVQFNNLSHRRTRPQKNCQFWVANAKKLRVPSSRGHG